MVKMLSLPEELFILALHEEKCSILSSAEDTLSVGLSAAALTELAVQGHLQLDERRRLKVTESAQTGDAILDDVIERFREADRPHKTPYWIGALADKPKKFRDHLIKRLVAEGLLQQEDKHLSWVIHSPLHPEQNASIKYALKSHLRAIVLACGQAAPKELALLSLLSACDILDLVFLKDESKTARRRISELLVGEALRTPAFQIVEEVHSVVNSLCESD
jgi:Golgi phosphoprotein 3